MKSTNLAAFYDGPTGTLTYAVWDPLSRDAIIIDPVLDFEPSTRAVAFRSGERLARFVAAKDLNVNWILETHAHADHLSAARELKRLWPGARLAVSARLREVFSTFRQTFQWPPHVKVESLGVDRWLSDGEAFTAGRMQVSTIATPGHTPACLTIKIGTWLFTGDALFLPDSGVGRCDFPGGSAGALWDSIWQKLYALSDDHLTFPGHDYQPGGRELRYSASLGTQKAHNIHLKLSTSRDAFIRFREARDKTLQPPRLLQPSLDWNLGAHQLVPRV